MKTIFLLIYNIVVIPILYILIFFVSLFNKKIKEGLKGRKQWKKSLKTQIKELPNKKNIFLFHATSVGELEQALPVMRLLKKRNPEITTGISFFSPSGYNFFKYPIANGTCPAQPRIGSLINAAIGPFDLLIAGTALAHQGTLVTNNTKEFIRVSELKIENWYE